MPPSIPPAWFVCRRHRPPSCRIGSWTCEPGRADLDGLLRLDREDGLGELPVEPPIPLDVRPEPGRHAGSDDLVDAAEGIALLLRLLDVRHTPLRQLGREHADGALVGGAVERLGAVFEERIGEAAPRLGVVVGHLPEADDVAADLDAEVLQQQARQGAAGHPHGRLAGARTVDDGADVVETVLLDPHEVGVAGAREGHFFDALAGALDGHHLGPAGAVLAVRGVVQPEGDGAAERFGKPDAGVDVHAILLDLRPAAAPVAEPPPRQVVVDLLGRQRHPRR